MVAAAGIAEASMLAGRRPHTRLWLRWHRTFLGSPVGDHHISKQFGLLPVLLADNAPHFLEAVGTVTSISSRLVVLCQQQARRQQQHASQDPVWSPLSPAVPAPTATGVTTRACQHWVVSVDGAVIPGRNSCVSLCTQRVRPNRDSSYAHRMVEG